METVKRISPQVRSAANYHTSLEVIRQIAESGITAKSGIMVGLGETPAEVEELMDDLISVGCKILTMGNICSQPTNTSRLQHTLLRNSLLFIKKQD